jgi:hypothetical protein
MTPVPRYPKSRIVPIYRPPGFRLSCRIRRADSK